MPCPRAPDKDTILRDMTKLMNVRKEISGINDRHMHDKTWLLAVLGSLNPKLEDFKKGYVQPLQGCRTFLSHEGRPSARGFP